MQQSSVLVYGDFENSEDALPVCIVFVTPVISLVVKRCDCGFQLKQSLQMITEHGSGALFYLANQHEEEELVCLVKQ